MNKIYLSGDIVYQTDNGKWLLISTLDGEDQVLVNVDISQCQIPELQQGTVIIGHLNRGLDIIAESVECTTEYLSQTSLIFQEVVIEPHVEHGMIITMADGPIEPRLIASRPVRKTWQGTVVATLCGYKETQLKLLGAFKHEEKSNPV